jgi:hypothetical protein
MARQASYGNAPITMTYKTSTRKNARIKTKTWKNKNIDEVLSMKKWPLAGIIDGEHQEIEYNGPVYYYNTNEVVPESQLESGINWGNNSPKQTTSRRNELKYLS